jgi:hypothetical protein
VRSTVNIFFLQEHFMKRKGLLLLVLAALVAGGAFAQKVGDTGDFMGKNYTVQEVRDGSVLLKLTPTLDGTWKDNNRRHIFTFNGNNAVYKQISPDAVWQDAVKKGYVKVGDQAFRNMKKTGDLTWTGQVRGVYSYPDSPNVAVNMGWLNVTITMSADGKTLSDGGPGSWTRQ